MLSKDINSPVTILTGVGPGLERRLHNLSIKSVQDLLFHLPYRYIDRTHLTAIGSLLPGKDAYIQGKIEIAQIKFGNRRTLLCRIEDGTGSLTLRFFHFNRYQQERLVADKNIRCWGQVRRGSNGLEMIHPEYQQIDTSELGTLEQTLTPVYPATDGLAQIRLRKLTDQAIIILKDSKQGLEDLIPLHYINDQSFPSLQQALIFLHRPPPGVDIEAMILGNHPAQRRLIFEELLTHQLSFRLLRKQIRTHSAYSLINVENTLIDKFLRLLPFKLTTAQSKVIKQINNDMNNDIPMLRLIQGDVGSGKTVISALAAIRAVSAGLQVALMAPTELLADQHYYNFQKWMAALDINVFYLTGKIRKSLRTDVLNKIETQKPLIVIGTHALFQEGINFSNLGLVIIDEQHRFGVHQRLALIEKGSNALIKPHQLIMTATPIPRTLAMSLFAELDVSTIDELPPGRIPVTTLILSNQKRDEIIDRISRVCKQGQQVYWVCTLIEESETMQCQAAVNTYELLCNSAPHLSIGLIHGRLKAVEKEKIMNEFKSGIINLLVATTVIEVGVDVPNASLMVIENAERMGLSQLHQLRGRVGRGKNKSHCVMLYQSPLSETAQSRLNVVRMYSDGFILAEKDLELRGPGDLLGTRQTGIPQMQIANLTRDAVYLPQIRKIADSMLETYPNQVEKLSKRWLSSRIEYAKV
ncbi:MAG: ATP-dependent DNA helicase RecG [Gammaproteobacteria bacterium]|jgi:ATP-dependent DNA helicase RecG